MASYTPTDAESWDEFAYEWTTAAGVVAAPSPPTTYGLGGLPGRPPVPTVSPERASAARRALQSGVVPTIGAAEAAHNVPLARQPSVWVDAIFGNLRLMRPQRRRP